MDDVLPPVLAAEILRLRRRYLDRLPETVAELRRYRARQMADAVGEDGRTELRRLFHTIKGSAASLGFAHIAAEAAAAEAAALAHLDEHISRLDQLSRQALPEPGADFALAAPAAPPVVPSQDPVRSHRIMILDDVLERGMRLAGQLSCFGFVPTVFGDAVALRQALAAAPSEAVVMDIDAAEVLAGLETPPPVVFVSARQDFQARLQAIRAGGSAYFPKTATAAELAETLDSLTRRYEPEPFRVLVVDDEAEVAAYHGVILEQAGMVTRRLTDPNVILEVLAEFKPDLVLMDMHMPVCSGRDLAALIRQIPDFISLPIVYLSSETDKDMQLSALKVGAEGFLIKPIHPDDLVTAVALRAERMRSLRSLMVRDSLTGLFNHTFLSQFLERALAAAGRETNGRMCFAMIDVDHFKTVNDRFGHPAGDQVLVALARILQQRLRNSDMVGRYGGEEFAAILQDGTLAEATHIIDQLRQDFASIRFHAGEQEFTCTFSAGIAAFPTFATAEGLMEAADRTLYVAKRQGRNCVLAAEG